jgi:hypothetical protein
MRVSFLPCLLLVSGGLSAAYLHESATLSLPDLGGNVVSPFQFLGSRFYLPSAASITALGGHIGSQCGWSGPCETPDLFLALVPLPAGIASLPSTVPDVPFSVAPLFVEAFAGTRETRDVRIPVDLNVPAGAYAVVFGSGLFGASSTSLGYMPTSGSPLPGADVIGYWNMTGAGATWQVFEPPYPRAERFWVEGTLVPEPNTFTLAAVSAAALFVLARARRRRGANH